MVRLGKIQPLLLSLSAIARSRSISLSLFQIRKSDRLSCNCCCRYSRTSTLSMQPGEKVLWDGPFFGRITKSGKKYLTEKGWKIDDKTREHDSNNKSSTNRRLAFVWPSKSGPQFQLNDSYAAYIRPYHKFITDALDDKLRLADLYEYFYNNEVHDCSLSILPNHISSLNETSEHGLYFVKHRYGAQGKSVYVYNQSELQTWWNRSKNRQEFVIQEEISPLLYEGRKFVIRSHILVIHRSNDIVNDTITDSSDSQVHQSSFQSYLHREIIVQHHAAHYERSIKTKASHVSQAGKSHPLPLLQHDLPTDHPARNVYPQIRSSSKLLISAFDKWFQEHQQNDDQFLIAPETSCFALLGLDWLVTSSAPSSKNEVGMEVKLCEVNSHPALGWGTTTKVPSYVFTDLVKSTLDILLKNPNNDNDKDIQFEPLFFKAH